MKGKDGFTIIEFVMVIVIAGIIAGITAVLLLQVTKVYSFVTVREAILSDGELAMERMTREIRQIKDDQSIYVAGAENIDFEFKKEVGCERVRFWLDGDILRRNNDALASEVIALKFQYKNSDNGDAENPEDTKRILLEFSIKKGDEEIKLRSQVYPRNL